MAAQSSLDMLAPLAFHHSARHEPHPDSEEAVKYEKRRVARELETSHDAETPRPSSVESDILHATPSRTGLRSRESSIQDVSSEHRQRHSPAGSSTRTQSRAIYIEDGAGTEPEQDGLWYSPLARFCTSRISLTIDDGAQRDHLALERTFLGYLRTSLMFAVTGVVIAQLFRLQANPSPETSLYVIGIPLSAAFVTMAIAILLIGAARFWRLQNGLIRGKALAGGWEVMVVMGLSSLLLVALFVLVLR